MSPTPEQALEALRRIVRVHYRNKGLTEICLSCGVEHSSLSSATAEHAVNCDLLILHQAISPPSAAAVPDLRALLKEILLAEHGVDNGWSAGDDREVDRLLPVVEGFFAAAQPKAPSPTPGDDLTDKFRKCLKRAAKAEGG